MKLLVIMPTKYLGNMVISMQSLAAIFADSVSSRPTLVVDESFESLCRLAFGDTCEYLVYPRRKLAGGTIPGRLRTYLVFARALRATRFDCALDMDGSITSGSLTRLARAKQKIGPDFVKRPRIYHQLVSNDRDRHHSFDDYRIMAQAIGVEVTKTDYLQFPPIDTVPRVPKFMPFPAATRIVCIHPCATKDYKQWDIHKFARLADRLMEHRFQVVILGAGEVEKHRVQALLDNMQTGPINAHGQLDLLQLLYVLQHADLFIGNDSGPMHLAAASGIPVIALFGPTELSRWQPRAEKARILKGPLPCSPLCRPEACHNNYQCLASLTVEQVTELALATAGNGK